MSNCDCMKKTDEALKEHGLHLDWSWQMDGNWTFIPINTIGKTKAGKDKKGPLITPKFCPLCGVAVGPTAPESVT